MGFRYPNLAFFVVNGWNKLPASVLDATSINSFKSHPQKLQSTRIVFLWTQAAAWSSTIIYMIGVTNQINDQLKELIVQKTSRPANQNPVAVFTCRRFGLSQSYHIISYHIMWRTSRSRRRRAWRWRTALAVAECSLLCFTTNLGCGDMHQWLRASRMCIWFKQLPLWLKLCAPGIQTVRWSLPMILTLQPASGPLHGAAFAIIPCIWRWMPACPELGAKFGRNN